MLRVRAANLLARDMDVVGTIHDDYPRCRLRVKSSKASFARMSSKAAHA